MDNTNIKKAKTNLKKLIKAYNNARGWVLIALVFFFFVVSAMAIIGPTTRTAKQLSDTIFEENVRRSQQILLVTNSPIRNYVVNELYDRIQKQLIDHLAKSGGTSSYMCQGVEVPAASTNPEASKLENQFGLCSPEKLFEGMDGNTKQSIDFNTAFGIKLDPSTQDEDSQTAIRSIMAQNENSYDYTLRTIFVRQELLEYGGIGKRRGELYHWLTRADVIATTNGANLGDIKQPLVIYYDVYLINEFYPNQFYGAGSACERKPLIVDPCPLYDSDTGFSQPRDCSTGYILNPDGSVRSLEEGERIQPGGDCKARGSGNLVILECLLPDGSIANLVSFRSVRPQLGCASLNSGRTKTGPDPKGYSFVLTVRTVSIGSSYN